MNIAIITDEYSPQKGEIGRSLINIHNGLEELGEKTYIFNDKIDDPKNRYYRIITSKYRFKSLFNQRLKFFLFLIFLFYKILYNLKEVSLKNKLKLGFYYCFYFRNLVNRIKTIRNLFDAFNKIHIDVVFCGKSAHPLSYGFIIAQLFNKPLITLAYGEDFKLKYPFNVNSILFNNIERIIFTNRILEQKNLKIPKINPKKVSIINLNAENISNQYQELIKEAYFNFYKFSIGGAFNKKLYNPF